MHQIILFLLLDCGVCASDAAIHVIILLFIYPAWPLATGALPVSKGGALPLTVC